MHWFTDVLRKYAVFEGRAGRKEYWMFVLSYVIVMFALGIVEGMLGAVFGRGMFTFLISVIQFLVMLAVLVPSIAVAVRRLHDTSRSGWWALLGLIPIINLVLLVFLVLDSTPGTNQYGSNPKGEGAADNTSVHQSEPEIQETKQAEDVVINDVPASEPIATVPETESASADASSDSSSDNS